MKNIPVLIYLIAACCLSWGIIDVFFSGLSWHTLLDIGYMIICFFILRSAWIDLKEVWREAND